MARCVIVSSIAVRCRYWSSNSTASPARSSGAHYRGVDRKGFDRCGHHGPIEDRPARAGLDEVVEAPGQQVDPGWVDAAGADCDPDVQHPNATAEDRAILVPVGARREAQMPEGALVGGQNRPLAQVVPR